MRSSGKAAGRRQGLGGLTVRPQDLGRLPGCLVKLLQRGILIGAQAQRLFDPIHRQTASGTLPLAQRSRSERCARTNQMSPIIAAT
jgi:hypothetical protein